MPRSEKNNERTEQVPRRNEKLIKVEPLHPQTSGEPFAQREEQLRDILHNLSDLIWEIDTNCVFTWCSGAAEDIFGVSAKELTGKKPFDFMPPEEAQRTKNIVEDIFLKKEHIKNLVTYSDDTQGKRHWLCVNGIPAFDNKHTLKGYIGVCRDITTQKIIEEALRESELKFRTLADEAFDCIVIHDGQKMIEVNKAFGKLWGYDPKEAGGLRVADFFSPEHREKVEKYILSGYEKPYEAVAIHKDGTRFPIEVAAKTITYKGRTMRVASIRDITERKQTEESLRESEEQFRTLAALSPAAIAILRSNEHEEKFLYVNTAWQTMTGYSLVEVVKLKPGDLIHPDMRSQITEQATARLRGEAIPARYENEIITKNGETRWLDFAATTIQCQGAPAILTIALDITERKKTEQEILEYQKHLKRLALQLTLAEEGERRRIASEIHDEISQTLAMAKIKLDAIRNSPPSEWAPAEIEQISSCIEKVIQETRTLTFELSNPILYELGFEAAAAEWLNENVQEKHGIATEFHDDGQPKPLDDDLKMMLFRNVRELLTNCIKHAKAKKISVNICRIDNSIRVAVEDNGVGFDPAQVRTTTGKKTTFGLFSIRENMENTGGRFEIESKPGAGCKATMVAPMKNTQTN